MASFAAVAERTYAPSGSAPSRSSFGGPSDASSPRMAAANQTLLPTRWCTSCVTFHSLHGVGSSHWSPRTLATNSPVRASERVNQSTESPSTVPMSYGMRASVLRLAGPRGWRQRV